MGHHAGKASPHPRGARHNQALLRLHVSACGCSHADTSVCRLPGTGFLARPDYIAEYRGTSERICGGVFYAGYDGWQQLGVQALGAVVITVFTGACRCAAGSCLRVPVGYRSNVLRDAANRTVTIRIILCGLRSGQHIGSQRSASWKLR